VTGEIANLAGDREILKVPGIFFVPSMDTHAYPGRGLSLSQLVFALNEELKRVAYSPSYVAKDHCSLVREFLRNDTLTSSTGSPLITFLNSPKIPQQRWQLSPNGGTPSFA
jgi:hypothetical protein